MTETIASADLASDIKRLEREGYRLDLISPADSPTSATMSKQGAGLRLELSSVADASPAWTAPLTLSRRTEGDFGLGRAGMTYRDLLPGRHGGRVVASNIRIDSGGDVDDYVHYHDIDFQMIFCISGWVDVVYQDQGPPFRLNPGDCVLQPPGIRHRVLRSSSALEVVEVGCPAIHDTRIDHDLQLPTETIDPSRDFGGQRFVRYESGSATWTPSTDGGFEFSDTGLGEASAVAGRVRLVRSVGGRSFTIPVPTADSIEVDIFIGFLLSGSATLVGGGETNDLDEGDAFTVSTGQGHGPTELGLDRCSPDFELLEIALPRHESTKPS